MWEIIDYSEEHFKEMIEMTTAYYGKENDISNEDFIRHEYFKNPAGEPYVKFAYDFENGRMAGQYIVLPRIYSINNNLYPSVLSLNTLTREEYRGQKVFTKLAEAAYDDCKNKGVKFCFGAPNPNSFPGFIKKLSFTSLGEMPLYLKIANPFHIVFDRLHINYKHLDQLNVDMALKESKKIIEITKENVYLMDNFWQAIKEKYSVIGVRDAKYFLWRYINLPRRDYVIMMAIKNNKPVGYIVGRITDVAEMRCGMIVDFLFKSGEKQSGQDLLNAMSQCFKKANIGLLGSLMHMHTEEGQLLRKNGFFVCPKKLLPQPFPIIFTQFNPLVEEDNLTVNDFQKWFFTMGDYDVI